MQEFGLSRQKRTTSTQGTTSYMSACVEDGKIEVEYVTTKDDRLADILTKPLGRLKFLKIRERIGIQNISKIGNTIRA